jgi:hypothetical protein
MSLAEEPEQAERCASCGSLGMSRSITEPDDVLLCERCADRQRAEGAISYWLPTQEEPPIPPEETFSELFRAARALLQEGIEDENVTYGTLALAHAVEYDLDLARLKTHIVYHWDSRETREALARDLARRCNGGLWPVGRGGEGSLLVKQQPAAARIEYYRGTEIPEQVDLMVFPHRAPKGIRSEDYAADCAVASYKEAMVAAGIPHADNTGKGPVDSYFDERGVMHVAIRHCKWPLDQEQHAPIIFSDHMPEFPHPDLVRNLCLAYLKGPNSSGFLRFLKPRKAGRSSDFGNVIPGCVAALLREEGMPWSSVRRLLNQEKINEPFRGRFPEDELDESYESRKIQLRTSAKRAHQRLSLIAAGIFHNPL